MSMTAARGFDPEIVEAYGPRSYPPKWLYMLHGASAALTATIALTAPLVVLPSVVGLVACVLFGGIAAWLAHAFLDVFVERRRLRWHDGQIRHVYRQRNQLIAVLAAGHECVLSYNDPELPDWAVLYLSTAEGQLSWHIHPDDLDEVVTWCDPVLVAENNALDPRARWDGHDDTVKHARLERLAAACLLRSSGDAQVRR